MALTSVFCSSMLVFVNDFENIGNFILFPVNFGLRRLWKCQILVLFGINFGSFWINLGISGLVRLKRLQDSLKIASGWFTRANLDPTWAQVGSKLAQVGPKLALTWLKLDSCWAHLRVPSCPWANPSLSRPLPMY